MGRQIVVDATLIASKTIDYMLTSGVAGLKHKLDIEKACDYMNYTFAIFFKALQA